MDEAARALVTFLVLIGALTTGLAIGLIWVYMRGELTISLMRPAEDDDLLDADRW